MLVLATVAATMGNLAGSAAAKADSNAVGAQSLGFLSSEVAAYARPSGAFTDGVWKSPNTICWACNNGGPASAAATAYMLGGKSDPQLLHEAEQTIDTAIEKRQRANGSFIGARGDTQSPEVATMFFGVEMGNTYLQLAPVLDAARRDRWQSALARASKYLIHNGNVTWYTNGNINLGNAELFYLTWRATGDRAFQTAYDDAWSFVLRPPQNRWPGDGMVYKKRPSQADGSDGSGFLAENGAGGTGFDPEYAELQLDVASRLYLISNDSRALHLANLLVNILMPRVDTSWQLNTSGGTRHTQADRRVPFMTAAFAVLGLRGGRPILAASIAPELKAIEAVYAEPWNFYGEVYRRALGNDISVIALATSGSEANALGARARMDTGGGSQPTRRPSGDQASKRQSCSSLSAARSRHRRGTRAATPVAAGCSAARHAKRHR